MNVGIIKQKINENFLLSDLEAILMTHICEVCTQLYEEFGHVSYKSIFQLPLIVILRHSQEIEYARI